MFLEADLKLCQGGRELTLSQELLSPGLGDSGLMEVS